MAKLKIHVDQPSRRSLLQALAVFGLAQAMAGCGKPSPAGTALIGGPFSLVDHNGAPRTDRSWPGQYLLVYFGYTYCPDVCPVDLQRNMAALDLLAKTAPRAGGRIQPLFITVDPERDTPAHMKAYVAAISPRLVGLTGSSAQVEAAKKSYRVYSQKAKDAASSDYLVEHTSLTYLIDPDGHYVAHFASGDRPDAIAAQLRQAVQ